MTQYMTLATAMLNRGPLTQDEVALLVGRDTPIAKNFSVYANLVRTHGGAIRAVREAGKLTYELTAMPQMSRRGRKPGTKVASKTLPELMQIVTAVPVGANSAPDAPTLVVPEPEKVEQPVVAPVEVTSEPEKVEKPMSFTDRMKLAKLRKREAAAKEQTAADADVIRKGITNTLANVTDDKLVEAFIVT